MPNPLTYNSSTSPTGTFKRSNISYGLMPTNYGTGYGSLTWYNSLDTTSKYVIVSDTYTLGYSTQGNAKPVMWSTGNTTNQNLIDLINGLPGNTTNFTDYYAAVNWLQGTNKYFLLNNGYENIVTDSLVFNVDCAWWNSFPTSGTTLTNLTTGGANGTLTNGPTFDSSNGGSLVFDGVDDYVYFGNPSSLQFGNTFSYGCWFYWSNTNIQGVLMGKRNGGSVGYNQYGMSIAATICCGPEGKNLGVCLISDQNVGGGNCSFNCGINATLPNSAGWVYGFCTVGPTQQKLYINGTLAANSTDNLVNCTFNIPSRSFYLGCTGGETEGTIIVPFNNKIAIAQAYNKTLSASEVLQNYNAQKGRFGL